jgi:hypothetical protein
MDREKGLVDETPEPERVWRERAEQLQQALDSRVVIEQAKGIISERLGIGVDVAFQLMRYAARTSRMKLRDLSAEIVAGGESPAPIVEAVARRRDLFHTTSRDERISRTEEFFRQVNEAIAEMYDGDGEFVCECGNPNCSETLELSKDDLRLLHARRDHYVVIPGHQILDVDEVVAEREGSLIVRKLRGG